VKSFAGETCWSKMNPVALNDDSITMHMTDSHVDARLMRFGYSHSSLTGGQ
jgi:hypothetical protein